MRHGHALLVAAGVAIVALAMAACSTPSESPGTDTTPPTSTATTAPPVVETTIVPTTAATSTTEAPPPTIAPNGVIVQIAISGFAFKPSDITVEPGTTIAWTNQDATSHTATQAEGSFRTGTIALDASSEVVMGGPGVYEYFCSIHPEMRGTITVEG